MYDILYIEDVYTHSHIYTCLEILGRIQKGTMGLGNEEKRKLHFLLLQFSKLCELSSYIWITSIFNCQ